MSITRSLLYSAVFLLALGIGVSVPLSALARGNPAHSETLIAGPYVVEVAFSEDPPQVEQPLDVTVVAHNQVQLSGSLTAKPGSGTDGVIIHALFTLNQKQPWILTSSIHFPVRGAWHLIFALDGDKGHGTASIDVTVTAPNAMPLWLGWLIGLSPLVGCAWLVWQQWRHRRKLLRNASA